MAVNFDFSESLQFLNLTFYKPPNTVDLNQENTSQSIVKLKDDKTLLYNEEEISLFAPVELLSIKELKLKTEVVLKKKEPKKWISIDGNVPKPLVNEEIYKDESEENKNSDLMELFKDIYSKGDENTKKAMDKSLQESCGTVLSTNWDDVKNKKIQPEK